MFFHQFILYLFLEKRQAHLLQAAKNHKKQFRTKRKSYFHHSLIALCREFIKTVMAHSLMISGILSACELFSNLDLFCFTNAALRCQR